MKPILGYFRLRGWAGPIRLLLAYLEVEYEEKNYKLPLPPANDANNCQNQNHSASCNNNDERDWKFEKNILGLQFPNLPYWIEDSVKMTETKAILRHIARTRNSALLGRNLEEKAKVNVMEEVVWDMWNSLCQACLINYDEKARNNFLDASKTKLKLLSQNFVGAWAVSSNQITVADFLLYEILYHYKLFQANLMLPFPRLESFMQRFENIPQISKYMNSKQFVKGPCFSGIFKSRL